MELLNRGEPGSNLPPISFEMRMAVIYRSEKKKIVKSQINLIKKVLQILKKAEKTMLNSSETDKDRAF